MSGVLGLLVRSGLRRRWRTVAAVAVVVAISGAVVLAMLAGARRTDTVVERFFEYAKPPDAFVGGGDPTVLAKALALPQVSSAASTRFVLGWPESRYCSNAAEDFFPVVVAQDAAMQRDVAVPKVVSGRLPAPTAGDEVAIPAQWARRLDLGVGDTLRFVWLSAEAGQAFDETGECPAEASGHVDLDVVGVTLEPWHLVSRDVDFVEGVFPLGFERTHPGEPPTAGFFAFVTLKDGSAGFEDYVSAVSEIPGASGEDGLQVDSGVTSEASGGTIGITIDTTRNGLLFVALVAAIMGTAAVAIVVARQVASDLDDDDVMRAMGLPRRTRALSRAVIGAVGGVLGAVGAAAIAVVLSPLFPIGLARQAELDVGVHLDLTALVVGMAVLVLGVALLSGLLAWRATSLSPRWVRRSRVVPIVAAAGASPPLVAGAALATRPGRGRDAIPGRSAAIGAIVAVAGVVAALVFASSMSRLLTAPERYGWDFDAIVGTQLNDDRAAEARLDELANDRRVEATAEMTFAAPATIDGHHVLGGAVAPQKGDIDVTAVAGHSPRAPDEIALGSTTLDLLGKSVGESVTFEGDERSRRMQIVGRAIFPATVDGYPLTDGFVITDSAAEDVVLCSGRTDCHRSLVVRYEEGVDAAAVQREYGDGEVLAFETPAPGGEVQRFSEVDRLPRVVVALVALLGAVTVAHAVGVTIARRRRELAVLATLGFTRAQIRRTLVVETSLFALCGLVVGVPVGLIVGRAVWGIVAGGVGVATDPSIPGRQVLVLVIATALFAITVGLAAGAFANRRRPGAALRSE